MSFFEDLLYREKTPNTPKNQSSEFEGNEGVKKAVGKPFFSHFLNPCAANTLQMVIEEIPRKTPKNNNARLRLDFTPDVVDRRPVCYLPQETPERLRGIMPPDLRGMGIPTQGLPLILRGISACGWTLESKAGRLELRKARVDARNREGVEAFLGAHRAQIAATWQNWEKLICEAGE